MENIACYNIERMQNLLNHLRQYPNNAHFHHALEKPSVDTRSPIPGAKERQNILIFNNFDAPNELISRVGHPAVKFAFNFSAFIKEGMMRIRIGHEEYQLEKNDWFTVMPGKIYQALSISPDASVSCYLNDRFYTANPTHTRIIDFYNRLSEHPVIRLSDENASEYLACLQRLQSHIENRERPYRMEFVKNYSNLIFLTLCNELLQSNTIAKHQLSRKEIIYQSFLLDIEKHYKTEHSVKFYADKLCITPKYLSSVIHQSSGKHASEWIDAHIILEAKALLKITDMSIQEIAYDLNFSTPTYFGRFFKRIAGTSPKRYRTTQ
jgi:YesN/AraC family two-component response regulator